MTLTTTTHLNFRGAADYTYLDRDGYLARRRRERSAEST